ncbi:AbrB family transcriptional regulator [Aurantimonas sp. MSK8Z-1]|uniref:AbrB family transcriptional regulator n=1 Tax=Mangrovibrevibacter kandeliae TaxID=2968473 RepID=UPI0021182351|nr:AbrB family transcriptional regulator [Aurantimonas sp. MSK8Z-1]MCW4115412.1 AbrB family transcriptional regulator [Aurantimonas sp. MSK8Z-1]
MLRSARPSRPRIAALPEPAQWALLLALSAVGVVLLELVHLPAALLLGPMAGGIVLAAGEARVRVPLLPFHLAQGIIGCMIAGSLTTDILGRIAADWPLFIGAVCSVLAASTALGWLLASLRVLPGTTAIWGVSPGAATAVVLMAEAFGADFRLVAFMQYLRVVFVAVAASVIARIWMVEGAGQALSTGWFPPLEPGALLATVAVAVAGVAIARRLRIPAGPLLVPMFAAAVLADLGWLTIDLPPWLLALSYLLVGWSIGLRFTRPILLHAGRALPSVAASTIALIAICGGFAALLVVFAGIDPLTAYLATSPGGADSVAIIAASSHVDLSFVMALQMARFLIVLFAGPGIARLLARRFERSGALPGKPAERR